MKKLLALLLIAIMLTSSTAFAEYKEFEISGGGGFAILDRSYEDQEESFLMYYHSGCSQSVKMMPAVKKYAKDNDLTLYIVDYRKGSIPGIGPDYFDTGMTIFPVAMAYNHNTNTIGGMNGIKSESDFKKFANKFFADKNPEIKLTIGSDVMICNGNKITLDSPATIINGRTMVPLRAIMEAFGFEVNWDEDTRTVDAKKFSTKVSMSLYSDKIMIGRMFNWLDCPPQIVNDRTLIPVRALSETMHATVDWDEATQTVTIG